MIEIDIPHDICTTTFVCGPSLYTKLPEKLTYGLDQRSDVPPSLGKGDLLDEGLIYTLKKLVWKYKKEMGEQQETFVSGGLQQYLIKQELKQKSLINGQKGVNQDHSLFNKLPVDVKLHIFSYLGIQDLCRISGVCRDWYDVSQDNLLWQEKLTRNIQSWNMISHLTNPALYREVQSEWSNKEIFLRCSPEINKIIHEKNSMLTSISNMLRYFFPKKVSKIAMFGPGLESENTSGLVRQMLTAKTLLEQVGMVPGQFDGVGSGWLLKMADCTNFQLSVLYSASKSVRQQPGWDRIQGNNLLQVSKQDVGQEGVELKPAVKDFCRTVDAFIYVVDSTSTATREGNDEFYTMVNERWSATHVPVLVLSCVKDSSATRIPSIKVVETLGMSNMNRPWQVRNCESENLTEVLEGIRWVVEQSHRR
ncbi:F-box only protein 4-like [Mizuhopecten yessoensis]|uniref:F-box only protein 4 n=1 Tax=Mizuhopecten yessoensis TaxID=6573 RepID=A0A210PWK9_MIZYE|nr:F-box only protein 4-like [Mizuhopecten yessoensis]OWF40842.1 F-box only protein 4 [Mizuhopecten yessoensis]